MNTKDLLRYAYSKCTQSVPETVRDSCALVGVEISHIEPGCTSRLLKRVPEDTALPSI